ncbi:MAG: lysylphosphatidylglycerol synthase transmembrane domain-containing protein [Lachnospiraceae bacterium]|nr:lysylphosphatidylglycerol synthase transmembrane domain-containing protein [Lachnospiraceae bacterium]
MKNKKKIIFNAAFLLIVFAVTLYGVFHGENLGEMVQVLGNADKRWLIPGVICVVIFIWGESIIIWYMMRSFGIHVKKWTCFLFSNVGFFFSCITPSASGGQPMQVYYMKKEKISIPVSTVILMIVTITYKLVLVVIGVGIMIFGQGFLHKYLEGILPVYYLGLILNVFCVSFMILLVFHPVLAKLLMTKGLRLLEKIHILKHREGRTKKLEESMDLYNETAAYLKSHILVMVKVFIITFAQRVILFASTWFVYRAFHLSGTSALDVIMLQAVISVSVDMLPLPGGMGISETLFLNIFKPVFGAVLLPAMVLSRGLAYYVQLLLSALLTGVAQLTIGREKSFRQSKTFTEDGGKQY